MIETEKNVREALDLLLKTESTGEHDGYTFYHHNNLKLLVKRYVERKLEEEMWPDIKKMYSLLHENGYTKDSPFIWNDLDNSGYVIDHDKHNVMVLTGQNFNFLIMYDTSNELFQQIHIRQFWEDVSDEDIEVDLTNAHWATQYFSDYKLSQYCNRPSLEAFEDADFDLHEKEFPLQHLDERDRGFVLSYGDSVIEKCKVSLEKFHLLGILGLTIQFGLDALNRNKS